MTVEAGGMLVEERGLSSRATQEVVRNGKLGNLSIPSSVQKLQTALQAKAKENSGFRFYALYDKIYREDILQFAYARCKANDGAAGVDGQDFEDIEAYGRDRWLGELAQELREKKYQPQAVRRVFIPKRSGHGRRPLGIPPIRDRTVQMAAVLVLGPIFEADLQPERHAYRTERNALTAVKQVHSLLNTGHTQIIDADLAAYFDTIPHFELLKSVARRVVDRAVLHLIQMWLEAPVEEIDERGNKKRTTRNRDEKRGTPVVEELNEGLRGWANYFKLGPVSKAYRAIDAYTTQRLRRWLCRKHKVGSSGYTQYPDAYLTQTLGLVRLPQFTHSLPWATA